MDENIEEWKKQQASLGNSKDELKSRKTWLSKIFEDISIEIEWQWRNKIMGPIRNFKAGVRNLFRYRKIVWGDRWWDYSFFLEMMLFKLKHMEENWVQNTHYVGDQDDRDTLRKLIEDLEWMLDDENSFKDGYEDEYKKRSRSFFGRLDRNHRKFWD